MSDKILKGYPKSDSVLPPYLPEGGVIRKDELQASTKARGLIAEAQEQAKKILEEAERLKAKVEHELEAAKKQGFQEGKGEGLEAFYQEILKVKALKEKFYAEAEPQMVELVTTIAEKVITQLTSQHQEVLKSIVGQALEHALGEKIVVRLHPEDFKRLREEEKVFKEKLDRTKHLHFKEDDTIQPGGCVVETEVGTIDAQLETQLKAIRKALGV